MKRKRKITIASSNYRVSVMIIVMGDLAALIIIPKPYSQIDIVITEIPKCKPIQAINNGHVHLRKKTDYVQGAVVKLKCRMGFMIEGAKRLECLANKKWNFNPGKCVRK